MTHNAPLIKTFDIGDTFSQYSRSLNNDVEFTVVAVDSLGRATEVSHTGNASESLNMVLKDTWATAASLVKETENHISLRYGRRPDDHNQTGGTYDDLYGDDPYNIT